MLKTSFRTILIALSLLLTFLCGVFVTRWFFLRTEAVESENSTVLLERIKQVAKLITVEGYFSEIYDYQDYYGYDLSFLRKKALIRVKAKVSVGYDLEKMQITAEASSRTIRIEGIPPAEILSIDHDMDYYDLHEGMFNSFSTEDYNKLNANAKEYIRNKALESDLMQSAVTQRNTVLETMRFMVEASGWKIEIEGVPAGPPADSLRL